MNLRPSNLEQARVPSALARDARVSDRDALIPARVDHERVEVKRRYSRLSVLALAVGGVLTVFWGGFLLWLLMRAVLFSAG